MVAGCLCVFRRNGGMGSAMAQARHTFAAMNPNEPLFYAPLPTEIPDYVWSPRYGRSSYVTGRPTKKPNDVSVRFTYPDVEAALKGAKRACIGRPGRWYGRAPDGPGPTSFWVHEGNAVVERHVVAMGKEKG